MALLARHSSHPSKSWGQARDRVPALGAVSQPSAGEAESVPASGLTTAPPSAGAGQRKGDSSQHLPSLCPALQGFSSPYLAVPTTAVCFHSKRH